MTPAVDWPRKARSLCFRRLYLREARRGSSLPRRRSRGTVSKRRRKMARTLSASAQAPRPASDKYTDLAALKAIAQAAIDVELFTIPLYMTSLYSIEGMHEINSGGNAL